jgi:hypothetical protein
MTAPISSLVPIVLVYDTAAGSPPNDPELAALGGKEVLLEPRFLPLPTQGVFYGQPGYSRQLAGVRQWVLTGGNPDAQIDTFVDSLTGQAYGWASPTARGTWKTAVQRMRTEGLPRTLIQQMTSGLFSAAKTELAAEQAQPPS